MALSCVLRIFSRASFSSSRPWSCFLRCLSSFSFSVILLISYLLSRFRRRRPISFLFFWILVSCYLSSFFSSVTRSSSSAPLARCFLFLRYFYFFTISSILEANYLSWFFSFTCWSTSLLRLNISVKLRLASPHFFGLTFLDLSLFFADNLHIFGLVPALLQWDLVVVGAVVVLPILRIIIFEGMWHN